MWVDELKRLLREDGEDRFYDVHYYRTVDSTNEVAKREATEHAPEGLVIIGEEQTAGKGRLGRTWVSPKGESIYFSILLRPDLPADHASALTLVKGLSVAQAVRELYALPVDIKWPNDVVIHGKKICGILTEAQIAAALHRSDVSEEIADLSEKDDRIETRPFLASYRKTEHPKLDYVIIGTGINVNNESFAPEIADRATSLRLELGKEASRAHVLALVLKRFHRNYETYKKTADLSGLKSDYDFLLVSRDQKVRVEDPKQPYIGISRGIDETGRLLVEMDDGSVRKVATGEVSVRGLYGYV